jgi:hypothetical protein
VGEPALESIPAPKKMQVVREQGGGEAMMVEHFREDRVLMGKRPPFEEREGKPPREDANAIDQRGKRREPEVGKRRALFGKFIQIRRVNLLPFQKAKVIVSESIRT